MENLGLKLVSVIVGDIGKGSIDRLTNGLNAQQLEVNVMGSSLKEKVLGYKTSPRSDTSLWVYRPQDTYAMGYITYDYMNDTGEQDRRYAVFSPNILNRKYSYGMKRYMSSAMRGEKGVSNAAKYLRPLTPKQVLKQAQREFTSALHRVKDTASTKANKVTAKIDTDVFRAKRLGSRIPNPLQGELKRRLQSDYVFLDKELEVLLTEAFVAIDEHKESSALHEAKHIFIEVVQSQGANVFRGFSDVGDNSRLFRFDDSNENKLVYTQEELPESLMGAISVLSMVEAGQYVSGVGYRAAENMFYIKGESE